MARIKVVYVISRIDYALGFDWVDKYLDKSKFDLHFIFLNPIAPKLHSDLISRDTKSFFIKFDSKIDYVKVSFKLMKLFFKIKPNVVHVHLIDACLTTMPVAYLMGIKKRIYTRHHSTYHFDYFPHAVKYDKLINTLSTNIIAISKNVENVLINKEHVDSAKVQIIHHGFELNKFVDTSLENISILKSKYNSSKKSPVIGVISRFTEWKGVQFIIPAFKKILSDYPDALIILANAQGDMETELFQQLAQFNSNQFCTIKFEKDLYSLYQLFDVFVHVPIDEHSEAFGQTYVESLAAGIPCVFTLSGIACEFVKDRENAVVVDYKNAEAIYQGIRLILNDPDLKNKLITNGRNDVMEQFDIVKMINSLEVLYAS
jgi:glycosyltransferase involved in cell wall biosynthesis